MSKRSKTILIAVGVLIVAYFVYRWYMNRQSGNPYQGNTAGTGSNLNSVAPSLVGGSQGPDSGLNYWPGNTQIDVSLPSPTTPAPEEKEPAPKPKPKPPGGIRGKPIPGRPPVRRPPTRR